MKKLGDLINLFLLLIIFVLTSGIIYLRSHGALPTQFSPLFIYLIIILNMIWILWNGQKDFVPKGPTKTEKS